LLLGYGLINDWSKIAIIDTENHSSELYAHLGPYNVISLEPPFNPEKFIEALRVCEHNLIEVVIIDSMSHEWDGLGGILELHSTMGGNSYTNWHKITPRHNSFIQQMLQAPFHVIGTIRAKQEYILVERNGKKIPEKVGLKGIIREGQDYDFTVVFNLNADQTVYVSKDRTGLFLQKESFKISPQIGHQILSWCNNHNQNAIKIEDTDMQIRINQCMSLNELLMLFQKSSSISPDLHRAFSIKKEELSNRGHK